MPVMRVPVCLVGALVLLGCGRGAAERPAAADSTAVAPAAAPVGTPAAAPAVVPASPAGSSPSKAADPAPIGRDSAFGPSFTVDSTGKVTPIGTPKKKP